MIAYKCLRAGAVGPFSRFRWPTGEPGPWVEAEQQVCATGVHACRAEQLPWWLDAELWRIELDDVREAERKLVASRGRLLGRVSGWNAAAARSFGAACAERTRAYALEPGYAADADRCAASANPAAAAFVAARAAELAGGSEAYEAERRRQAEWLADRLGLELTR